MKKPILGCALLAAATCPLFAQTFGSQLELHEHERWSVEIEDGTELYGESFGEGPDLLFVHGGPSFPPLKLPEWLVELAHARRVHLFHQRGSGRSTRLIDQLPGDEDLARSTLLEVYGLEPHLADIGRVLDARLSKTEPVTLIGHSFGAYLAALFAAREPRRVAELVLLAPADVLDGRLSEKPIFTSIKQALAPGERASYDERLAIFLAPGVLAGATDGDLALRTDWFGWYFLNAMKRSIPKPDAYPPMRWAGGCAVAGVFLGIAERGDATKNLARVAARAIVLHAADDLSPRAASKVYAEAIRGARLVTVAETSHFFQGAAAQTAREIEGFLRETPVAR